MIQKLLNEIVLELDRLVKTMEPTPRLAELVVELIHRIYAEFLLWVNDSPLKRRIFSA